MTLLLDEAVSVGVDNSNEKVEITSDDVNVSIKEVEVTLL